LGQAQPTKTARWKIDDFALRQIPVAAAQFRRYASQHEDQVDCKSVVVGLLRRPTTAHAREKSVAATEIPGGLFVF
jgi:hypothetical protein